MFARLSMSVAPTRLVRRRWGRALTRAALTMTVCTAMAFTGLTPASAGAAISTSIGVGACPNGVALSPDGTQAYVTNVNGNSVSVIDTATGTVRSTIAVGEHPEGVAFSPDGALVYVTSLVDNSVSVISVATGKVTSTIGVGRFPWGVAFSPDGALAYVTSIGSNAVSVITVATGTLSTTIPVGDGSFGVAFSPDGALAYVTLAQTNSVSVITVATGTVSTTLKAGQYPVAVAFSPDGAVAYVSNFRDNTVSAITVKTGTVRSTMGVVGGPWGVAFSPDGSQAYVATPNNNSVWVITVATDTARSPILGGGGSWGVAFSPDGTQVYATNENTNSVSVIATGLAPMMLSMETSASSTSVQAGSAVTLTTRGYSSRSPRNSTGLGLVSPVYTTDGNGVLSGSTVTFSQVGSHTVTATLRGVRATMSVSVTPAALASITISPATATVQIGDSITFGTTGWDRYGNSRGAVTGDSVFSSDNRTDQVKGSAVQFGIPGKRTVTAADGVFTATSVITVPVGPLTVPLPFRPMARHTR